jgi:hypothetical protein
MRSIFLVPLLCTLLGGSVPAAAPAQTLAVWPRSLELQRPDERHDLLAAWEASGLPLSLANNPTYISDNPAVAEVSPTGTVTARGNGTVNIHVRAGEQTASVAVRVALSEGEAEAPWSFNRHILPILSKANCNGGGCHGALAGKGGFRLSLAAYDPASDHLNITRDALGRRVEPSDPLRSLLLTKPTAATPHKGGRRLDTRSEDYRILAEWIASGAAGPKTVEAGLDHLEILPPRWNVARKGERLRFLVRAHYGDGRVEDVTRWAKFTSTDETMLRVNDANGGVEVTGSGEGAVTAWFSSRIVLSRVLSPFPEKGATMAGERWLARNLVDEAVHAQLQQLHLVPSPLADDATFLRRASLDITGMLPTPEAVRAFLADPSPAKRDALIEKLLASPEFADNWTYRWADIFLISGAQLRPDAVKAYYGWLRRGVEKNTPWDALVRELVTARGESFEQGATNFFAVHQDPETMAENVSQAFMGLSINCAKCHNHPLEKWTNDQYYAFANLFARVRAKGWGGDVRSGDGKRTLYTVDSGELLQPKSGRHQPAAPLDEPPVAETEGGDRREALAAWLTSPKNPYFTRAIVNRVWAAFFGLGIVNSVDDLRASNPATNEPLMDALSRYLIDQRYDLKSLMRLILQSATYQRSSETVPGNEADTRYFARYYPRRMTAEVLSDAISAVTGVPDEYTELVGEDGSVQKTDAYPKGKRALQLADSSVKSYFLKTFGRNQRAITCECERSNQPSIVQALHLSNGNTLNGKLASKEGNLERLLSSNPTHAELVETAYLRCLNRLPNPKEKDAYTKLLDAAPVEERRASAEDLFWALLTSREFLFQH